MIRPEDMVDLTQSIPSFAPASGWTEDYAEIMLRGAERFPGALEELGRLHSPVPEPIQLSAFQTDAVVSEALRERLNHHGSDKSKYHSYHLIYGGILAALNVTRDLRILEIGIGSTDPAIISNMGENGVPGASLRAFRDVAKNAHIFGADIDAKILFDEPRIQTAWVDQMKPASFDTMHKKFGVDGYDLIIDDGLHQISANLNTLLFGLAVLNEGGWIAIEDIWNGKAAWNSVYRLLPESRYNKFIIQCPEGCLVFLVQKT